MKRELDYMKLNVAVACLLTVASLPEGGAAQSAAPEDYGSWMRRPADEWPKIAVINQIEYEDKHYPVAGCGCLVQFEDEVVAADRQRGDWDLSRELGDRRSIDR